MLKNLASDTNIWYNTLEKKLLEISNGDRIRNDKEDFVVVSSGALVLRGIMDTAGDLDITVTNIGLDYLKTKYDLEKKDNGWYKVNDMVECVLDNMEGKKELLENYYVQDINDYLKFLKGSKREKDKLRIPLVEEYIRTR